MASKKPVKLMLVIAKGTDIDSTYVFNSLFRLSSRTSESAFGEVAKELVTEAAKRAPEGLFVDSWKEIPQKYGLSRHQYFYILRTLKNAGILERHLGKYYLSRDFNNHMMRIASVMSEFFMKLGVSKVHGDEGR